MLDQHQRRDQKAAQEEENGHAKASRYEPLQAAMTEHDDQHRQRPHAVQ
jgi:hypothetical protein